MPSSSLVAGRLGDDDSWSRQQGAAVSDDVLSEPCHCSSFVSSTAAMLLELFVIDRHNRKLWLRQQPNAFPTAKT
jgi:hypothetical protein